MKKKKLLKIFIIDLFDFFNLDFYIDLQKLPKFNFDQTGKSCLKDNGN